MAMLLYYRVKKPGSHLWLKIHLLVVLLAGKLWRQLWPVSCTKRLLAHNEGSASTSLIWSDGFTPSFLNDKFLSDLCLNLSVWSDCRLSWSLLQHRLLIFQSLMSQSALTFVLYSVCCLSCIVWVTECHSWLRFREKFRKMRSEDVFVSH